MDFQTSKSGSKIVSKQVHLRERSAVLISGVLSDRLLRGFFVSVFVFF